MATWRDADVQLLRTWRAAAGQSVSAAGLAHAAGAAVDSIPARIDGLRAAGYGIDGPNGLRADYRLVSAPTGLIADDLRAALPEQTVVGREILVFEETDSTNDLAARAGRDGIAEGLVIFAESQRAGRGRLGRRWVSPPGRNLLFSVLLRPSALPERWPELTFCAALAVAETAEHFTGLPARIKWPNDVLLSGRKVAGILLESHHGQPPGFVVAGIGLNVLQREDDFPPELREKAGSLTSVQPAAESLIRREVAAFLLERLERHYALWPNAFVTISEECARRGCVLSPASGYTASQDR